jgi:hypothetical protein
LDVKDLLRKFYLGPSQPPGPRREDDLVLAQLTPGYAFIDNPGNNADRGPVNAFAGRFHRQF